MIPGMPRNPAQMRLMMKRLGMSTEELPGVEEVVVRTDKEEHVFKRPEVTILTVQGVRTYQVVGQSAVRPRSSAERSTGEEIGSKAGVSPPVGPAEEDVVLVMDQAQVSREEAIAALQESGGAPAEAILKLLSHAGGSGSEP